MTALTRNFPPALAQRLGALSLGLGVAELLGSEPLGKKLGLTRSSQAWMKWLLQVAAITAVDLYGATRTAKLQAARVPLTILILRPPHEVETFWHAKKSASCELVLKFQYASGGKATLVSTQGEIGDRRKVRERLRHLKKWIESAQPAASSGFDRKAEGLNYAFRLIPRGEVH